MYYYVSVNGQSFISLTLVLFNNICKYIFNIVTEDVYDKIKLTVEIFLLFRHLLYILNYIDMRLKKIYFKPHTFDLSVNLFQNYLTVQKETFLNKRIILSYL